LAFALLAVALGLAQLKAPIQVLQPDVISRKDLIQEYAMARAIVDRLDPYLPTNILADRYLDGLPNEAWPHPTPHPPTLGLLFVPLTLFDYPTACAIWLVLELFCLVVAVYLIARALHTALPWWAAAAIAAVLLIWYPVWSELVWGQLQIPTLALLAGTWLALRSERPALGGALVGVAMLLKPLPWPLLLWFALRRDWSALAAGLSVIAVGYGLAGFVVGWRTFQAYFFTVLPLVTRIYRASWGNTSVASLAWRLFDGTGSEGLTGRVAAPLVYLPLAARAASIAFPAALLALAGWVLRKQRSLDLSFGVMIIVSILLGPIAWPHYLVLAIIPAAQVVRWLAQHRFPSRETNRTIVVAMLLVTEWVMPARMLALRAPVVDGRLQVPFAVAQLPLMAGVAAASLAWLVVGLETAPVAPRATA
jgi:hypothetical protein